MKRRGFVVFLSLFILIILAGLFLISSNEKLEKPDPEIYKGLDDFKTKKTAQLYKSVLLSANKKASLEINEQELNDLIAIAIQNYEKSADAIEISGYSTKINKENIVIKLDSKLINLIPTQYALEIKPSIVDNRINFVVTGFKVGKLPIGSRVILKQLQTSDKIDYYVDIQQQSIVIENRYPKQMIFNDIKLEQGKLSMEITMSVKNLKDVMEIIGTVLP